MPRETKNFNSWFRRQRLQNGYKSQEALAQAGPFPLQSVNRWEQGSNRPPWPRMTRLVDLFHVQPAEAVLELWGEVEGDPCPRQHGCNGTKILPDDPLVLETLQPALRRYAAKALRLLIKIKCSNCGRDHAYPPYGPHPKICLSCSRKREKARRHDENGDQPYKPQVTQQEPSAKPMTLKASTKSVSFSWCDNRSLAP